MFSLKVETNADKGKDAAASSSESRAGREGRVESLEFSVGNQRVEHVTGIIHLYRRTTSGKAAEVRETSEGVCVLSVPADVGVQEFCRLCGAYLPSIKEMRFLRRENTRETSYMVYLLFREEQSARGFVEEHNGRPFCAFEEEIVWKLLYVDSLEFSDDPKPALGETELPTCPVCLERLDENISGVVVTVCNHLFHNECLMKWGDTSCPVCRHCMQAPSRSSCINCGVSEDLWICLICGHVGCGRYKSKHAFDHWEETQHCYALELESQRVWDYVGDGYVHRLVQSKSGGKLVELTPAGECSGTGSSPQALEPQGKVDYDRDEAIVASKIDAVAFEYNHLLSAQLESQRLYFEGILLQNRMEADAKLASMNEKMAESATALEGSLRESREAVKQKKTSAKKATDLGERIRKVEEEKEFLRQLNETLIDNQKEWKTKTEGLQKELAELSASKDSKIRELEEQVRDLIMFIEAQKVVEEEGGEMQGGSLVVQEQQAQEQTQPKHTRRRRTKK